MTEESPHPLRAVHPVLGTAESLSERAIELATHAEEEMKVEAERGRVAQVEEARARAKAAVAGIMLGTAYVQPQEALDWFDGHVVVDKYRKPAPAPDNYRYVVDVDVDDVHFRWYEPVVQYDEPGWSRIGPDPKPYDYDERVVLLVPCPHHADNLVETGYSLVTLADVGRALQSQPRRCSECMLEDTPKVHEEIGQQTYTPEVKDEDLVTTEDLVTSALNMLIDERIEQRLTRKPAEWDGEPF